MVIHRPGRVQVSSAQRDRLKAVSRRFRHRRDWSSSAIYPNEGHTSFGSSCGQTVEAVDDRAPPPPGVVNRHLAGPYFFEFVSAPGLEGVEVPLDGISKADGPCLATGEFNGTNELWKPMAFSPFTIPSLRVAQSAGRRAESILRLRRDPVSTLLRAYEPPQLTLTSQQIRQRNSAPDTSCDL